MVRTPFTPAPATSLCRSAVLTRPFMAAAARCGGAANTFEFIAGQGGGTDVLQGFRVGTDHLVFKGVTVTSQTVSGGVDNILLSDNTHLQLAGVSILKTFG